MNYSKHGSQTRDEQNRGTCVPESPGAAAPRLQSVSGLKARDQIEAIIEASENPEASLRRAHLAIATRHKELETLAWRELETRLQP